ncbi:methylated-DNA--cysteine S-met [Coniochaeta ligniaria NRRL 30616]|uniref:Methylated-DNA--protein-cysteine methyltransferase n=1 Tax=Coniochaeta ligniaria NRRL 30616 TaxID=1408157 RepID=A0A1J7JD79_9PEZI|nr:methylated-DNA--cysteine S-met [Coniochaeta ligniaria NRRL 30616]
MACAVTTTMTTASVTTKDMSNPTEALTSLTSRISRSPYTPFQKSVWVTILQIPRGSVSTYNIVALHLRSSPRAVGNALRRNPFAPEVPCHRVVATNASLGGFKGKIARRDGEGITLVEKRTLLRNEGVKFDDKGRVLGTPFSGFA